MLITGLRFTFRCINPIIRSAINNNTTWALHSAIINIATEITIEISVERKVPWFTDHFEYS
ncbi:hypothetical protein LDE05_15640 [Lactobacillus delbrueckii subsp. bulgaricus]|nr:hypothetical protein LDE05_15640 [Lactobacillus delbrueckii subsp. bulgaricus]